ncbi:MAG: beta-lactamase family protein, partial [Sphingomonadales bacterium]|nr:beta-lactamase family protein [Sphingomonadales bacterium]
MSLVSAAEDDQAEARRELRSRLDRIVSQKADNAFGTSGAVFAIAARDGTEVSVAVGEDARGVPITDDSLTFLASASKLATGLLILRLMECGLINLDAEIGTYLPDARSASTPGVTIKRLLSHTSGLPLEVAHDLSVPPGPLRLVEGMRWPNELAAACLATPPVHEPGTVVQYSNVAFGLLGLMAERVAGQPFGVLLQEFVFSPLLIEAYVGRTPDRHVIAVSDIPSPYARTILEPYNSRTFREMGAPWAGVITNAAGLQRLVRSYAAQGSLISAHTAELARTDHAAGLNGGYLTTDPFIAHGPSRTISWSPCPWGLSIELQGGKQPHWAPPTMPDSFGQIGSSGCLGWHDPASGVSWA